ncbi:MAG: NAD(P)/FAD-dependent oxidoreductase [Mycobacteriales bacterium]
MSANVAVRRPSRKPHILVLGGGYVGMYTAYRLQKLLRRGEASITIVDQAPNMTYQPFLPEAAAGSIEPRHVVVPLRRVLRRCDVLTGTVTAIDHSSKKTIVKPLEGDSLEIDYDILVVALGSIARTLPIPGLDEVGIGFRSVGEAIYLRNHVLSRLDFAATSEDPELRRRALTFVFIGGGYAGVEAFAELEDMARYAVRLYPDLAPEDMRWVLVEATGRILPEVSTTLSAYTANELTGRGMEVDLNTRVESLTGGHVALSNADTFDADTVVWTAGVRANPLVARSGLPVDEKGRLRCAATLRVQGIPDAWGAGDCARVPDLSEHDPDATCGPSAQHAVRQAKQLAENIAAAVRGGQPKDYVHAYAGSVASLGLHKGVAEIYGVKLRGFAAWFMHRTYHVSRMPTLNRKVRVLADWTLSLFFRREVVSLGEIQDPRRSFVNATKH